MMVVGLLVLAFLPMRATLGVADPVTKSAIVHLSEPTLIGRHFVMGPVVFEHDDSRMANGEPCTFVYRFDKDKGVTTPITSFHCKPRPGTSAPELFSMVTTRDNVGNCVLQEYQFAGDTEAHRVPTPADR
jgi:hypothetical protein